MINNKTVTLIYRALLAVVCITATVLTFTDRMVSLGGDGRPFALFFTAWTVWIATIVSVLTLIDTYFVLNGKKAKYNDILLLFKLTANLMAIATFIVAAFVLPDKIWTSAYWELGSIFKHFLLPILTVVDSVLFNPRNTMKVYYPVASMIIPLIYWVLIMGRAVGFQKKSGGMIPAELWDAYYPYGFTNLDNGHTLGGLIGMLAGILAGLLIIGYIYYLVDRFTGKKEK